MREGTPAMAELLDAIGQLIETEEDLMRARNLIFGLLTAGAIATLSNVWYETALQAELGARLQPADTGDARLHASAEPATLASAPHFNQLPFKEAVDHFKQLQVMPAGEFAQLEERYRARAFSMGKAQGLTVIRDAHTAISDGMERGTPKRDVMGQLRAAYTSNGEAAPGEHYLSLVYDNATLKSYAAGRWAQLTHPDVVQLRPLLQYRTRHDEKVRASHRALDGKVYPVDHEFWQTYFPPNGHRCRCGVDSLSGRQVAERKLPVEDKMPGKIEVPGYGLVDPMPPPGWRTSPAMQAITDAAGDRARGAVNATPLPHADPAGLVRDDAKRAAVIERFTGMEAAKVEAQLAEVPAFAVEIAPADPGPAEAIVDWHTFAQNDQGAAQLAERLVERRELRTIGERLEVVPRVSFDAALDRVAKPDPEVVWLDAIAERVSPPGRTVGASPEVAIRMRLVRNELGPLLGLLQEVGESRPGDPLAVPVRGAWNPMSCVVCAGDDPTESDQWKAAWRLTRPATAGPGQIVVLARERREGWEARRILVNASLWATLA